MKPMILRRQVTEATKQLFLGAQFAWGSMDCAVMIDAHLRPLGHAPRFERAGAYSTALGAKRAFLKCGYRDAHDWLDDIRTLERIGWARAIIGDVVAFQTQSEGMRWHGLGVCLGNQRILTFTHVDGRDLCVVFAPAVVPDVCWRTVPCPS